MFLDERVFPLSFISPDSIFSNPAIDLRIVVFPIPEGPRRQTISPSFSIEKDGDLDEQKLQAWISKLLSEKGVDIFRMKGFLSIAGESDRFVFQGVHMIFSGKPDRPWGSLPRRNQLVFIGRNLDENEMRKGFEDCLV